VSWHCSHCDFSSFSKGSRDSHTNDVHKASQEFVCPHENCTKTFDRISSLNRHIKTDHDSKTFPTHVNDKQNFEKFPSCVRLAGKNLGKKKICGDMKKYIPQREYRADCLDVILIFHATV